MAYNLDSVTPSPEAVKEAEALKGIGPSLSARLCQLLSDTASEIVDAIASGAPIDPAPYRALVLQGERSRLIGILRDAGLTKQQAQAARDAIRAAFVIEPK